jgi:hypothetical protein
LFFKRGQNNRADKPGSIPKEWGHGIIEERSQFVSFLGLGDELHDSRTQLYRHCILKGYRHGLLRGLQAAGWNFPYGATWNHGVPRELQFNELLVMRNPAKIGIEAQVFILCLTWSRSIRAERTTVSSYPLAVSAH